MFRVQFSPEHTRLKFDETLRLIEGKLYVEKNNVRWNQNFIVRLLYSHQYSTSRILDLFRQKVPQIKCASAEYRENFIHNYENLTIQYDLQNRRFQRWYPLLRLICCINIGLRSLTLRSHLKSIQNLKNILPPLPRVEPFQPKVEPFQPRVEPVQLKPAVAVNPNPPVNLRNQNVERFNEFMEITYVIESEINNAQAEDQLNSPTKKLQALQKFTQEPFDDETLEFMKQKIAILSKHYIAKMEYFEKQNLPKPMDVVKPNPVAKPVAEEFVEAPTKVWDGDDDEDLTIASLGAIEFSAFTNLGNLLNTINPALELKPDSTEKDKLVPILKTIGLETVGECKLKKIWSMKSLVNYCTVNRDELTDTLLVKQDFLQLKNK